MDNQQTCASPALQALGSLCLLASLHCLLSYSMHHRFCCNLAPEQDYKMHKSHQLASGMSALWNTWMQGCSCSVGLPRQDLGVQARSAPGAPHGACARVPPGKHSHQALPC